MPVSTVISSREEFLFAIAPQTTWGTAETTDSSFRKFDLTAHPIIDWSGVLQAENKRAGKGLSPHYLDRFRRETGMYPTFSMEGVLTNEEAHLLIQGVMQDIVSEPDISPYKRTHEWDEATTGRSGLTPLLFFTANSYDPQANVKNRLKNCVIHTLRLAGAPDNQGGRVTFQADFTSLGAAQRNATLVPGSWVEPGSTYLHWDELEAYSLGGNELNLLSWELVLTNGMEILPAQAGEASGVRFTAFTAKLNLKTMYDAITKDMLAKWLANPQGGSAELEAILRYNGVSAANMLQINLNAILDAAPGRDFGTAQGVTIDIPLLGVNDGTNEALEIQHANNTQTSWA